MYKKVSILILFALLILVRVSFSQNRPFRQQIEKGKILFRNCSNCHKISTGFIGPPFQFVREVRGRQWTYSFILNPPAFASKNKDAMKIVKKYRQIMPPSLLTKEEIDAICDYVDSFPYNPKSKEYDFRKK